MKKCPYCKEEIQDDAIKCKHCGSLLSKIPNEEVLKNKQKWYKWPWVWVAGIILIVIVIASVSGGSHEPSISNSSTNNTNSQNVNTNTEPINQGKVEVKSSSVKGDQYVKSVVGEVINNTTRPTKNIQITATLYDKNGTVVDTNFRTVASEVFGESPLQPTKTTPFDIGFISPKPFETYKLDVTWQ